MNTTEDLRTPENSAPADNNQQSHLTNAEKEELLKADVLDEDETPSYAFGLSLVGVIVALLLLVAGLYYGVLPF